MLAYITDITDKERAFLPFKHDGKDEVVLLVNNLGGMSELELSSIANDAVKELEEKGKAKITVKRIIVGTIMVSLQPFAVLCSPYSSSGRARLTLFRSQTSLNLPGFSLTTLLLPREGDKYSSAKILELFDSPASAPGWRFTAKGEPGVPAAPGSLSAAAPAAIKSGGAPIAYDYAVFEKVTSAAAEAVIKAEPEITR